MYSKILVATDGSDLSGKAVSSAIALAGLTGAELVVLKVVPITSQSHIEGSSPSDAADAADLQKVWLAHGRSVVDAVAELAVAKGIKTKAITVKSDLVAEAIIASVKKHKCDLIVMASHGRRGLKRLLLGSETQQVLTHSHVPVLVLR